MSNVNTTMIIMSTRSYTQLASSNKGARGGVTKRASTEIRDQQEATTQIL
jgi:hypothetical protein